MSIGPVAGVDVSKRFSDMCILAPDNSVFRRVKIYHDLTSMQRSLSALQDAENEFGTRPVIVMESTAHYHRLIWKFMSEAGYDMIVINPIQSGGLKNINVRKIKNDKVDAYKIAALYRLKNLRPSNMPMQAITLPRFFYPLQSLASPTVKKEATEDDLRCRITKRTHLYYTLEARWVSPASIR